MSKLIKFILFSLPLISFCAFAQSIFDPSAAAKSSAGYSADDFRKSVKESHQQNMNQLKQETIQSLPPAPNSTNMNKTPPIPGSAQPSNNPSSVDNSFSSINGGSSGSSSSSSSSSRRSNNQPSNNSYTGFGGGDSGKSNKSNTPASSGSSGGWNINY